MSIRFKRSIYTGLIVITIMIVAVVGWSNLPIKTDISKPDPAVILANEIGANGVDYQEGYSGTPGTRIHYVTAGQGEPIVFLHGFPSYWFTMFGLMEEFKSQYRVIAVDGLGVGKSDAPTATDEYEVEKLVKHLDTVLADLDLDSVHLVGHDWGAAIATSYAHAYPSKVKTVTAIGALPHNVLLARLEKDLAHREVFSYMSRFKSANPALIKLLGIKEQVGKIYAPFIEQGLISEKYGERIQADIGHPRRLNRFINWYRANFPDFDEINESNFWPSRDSRLTQPALFIYGEDDIVVSDELVSDFQNASDKLKVIPLKGVGHRPHFEEKEKVVTAIRDLIDN